ncbi:MAG: hypothetical protein JNG85_01940 [Spirochaetaceae bacterium]|nr:hypothetical protein [Spirochaetaceae bacterium]
MKRLAVLLLPLFLALATAPAQEAGFDLQAAAGYSATDAGEFSASGKLKGWFRLPLSSSARFSGSGYLQVGTIPAGSSAGVDAFKAAVDELGFELAIKAPVEGMQGFSFDLGRFPFEDPTGQIVSTPADGLGFGFHYPNLIFSFRAGYTGFLFRETSDVAMSLADAGRAASTEVLGPARFLGLASLELPPLFGQRIGLSFLAQEDLNPESAFVQAGAQVYEPGKGGPLDTQYFTLRARGPIAAGLRYEAFAVYGTGRILSWLDDAASPSGHSYRFAPIQSGLFGLSLALPLESFLPQATVGLKVLVATGDKEASSATEGNTQAVFHRFTPVTSSSLGLVYSPSLANLAFVEASLGARPDFLPGRFQAAAKLMTFLRTTAGPVSEAGLDPASTSAYLGTELDLVASYGIYSDLGLLLTLGAFLPGVAPAGAFSTAYAGSHLQFAARLAVTLAL